MSGSDHCVPPLGASCAVWLSNCSALVNPVFCIVVGCPASFVSRCDFTWPKPATVAVSAKQTSQAGPVQSNGICLLDLPAQFHWNPWASTWLTVALPQVQTCPGPTSDPGGFRSWTRAPGGVVGPDRASAAATTLPGISARQ